MNDRHPKKRVLPVRRIIRTCCLFYVLGLSGLLFFPRLQPTLKDHGALYPLLEAVQPAAHFVAFLLLGVVVGSVRHPLKRNLVLAGAVLYAGVTELVQEFLIPGRTGEWGDFWQDLAGLGLGVLMWAAAEHVWRKRHRRPMHTAAEVFKDAEPDIVPRRVAAVEQQS